MKVKTPSKSQQRYTVRRQRVARILATLYIVSSNTPLLIGLAAPQVYFRPAAGVSRLPLQTAAFDTPGFGDVADAINLATGNVYVAMDGASRNNILEPGKDETTSNMGGNWNLTSRLRLGGFLRTHSTPPALPTTPSASQAPMSLSLASGDGAAVSFNRVTMAASDWDNAPSWIKRYRYSTDIANTSFYALTKKPGEQYSSEWVVYRTRTGTVPTVAFSNTFTNPNRLAAVQNFNGGNMAVASPSLLASSLDIDGQLDGFVGTGTIGSGYLVTNLNLTNGSTVAPSFVAAVPPGSASVSISLDIDADNGSTYAGTHTSCLITSTPATCSIPSWTYNSVNGVGTKLVLSGIPNGQTVYFGNFNSRKQLFLFSTTNTITNGSQVNSNINLNASSANLSATQTKAVPTNLDGDGRIEGFYSAAGGGWMTLPVNAAVGARLNPSVVVGIQNGSASTSVSIGLEDQTGLAYPGTARICTVSSVPSICEVGDWTKTSTDPAFLAIRGIQAGQEIFVGGQNTNTFTTNGTLSGVGTVAQYYDHAGTRSSFYNDGEFADYQQNLYQQLRAAKYNNDPEGEKTACAPDVAASTLCTPKTEFTYDPAVPGRLTKVKDQWGRVSTYEWNTAGALNGTLTNINYLLRNEGDNTSYTRRAAFQYDALGEDGVTALPQQTVKSVTYTAFSGKKDTVNLAGSTFQTQSRQGLIARTFNFKYKKIGNTIAVSRITRPTQGVSGEVGIDTVYNYYPTVLATDTVGVAKAGRLSSVQQFRAGTGTKVVADMVYDLVPGIQNTYGGMTYTMAQGPAGITQKRNRYLFDVSGQLREKQIRDASTRYDVQGTNPTSSQDRDLSWKYEYFTATTGTAPQNTFILPAVIDTTSTTKNFNWGGVTLASPATQTLLSPYNTLDPNATLDGFVSSATGGYLNTKLNAVAGKTITPSIAMQTTTGTALVYLGIQTLGGVGQVTEKVCTATTTPSRCTMDAFPVPANSVDLQFAVSIQASKIVYLGGQNSGAFTVDTSATAPIGSTKSVTDPAGKRLEYGYDTYGNVNNLKTFPLLSSTAEREEQWVYDVDNRPVTHTVKGQSGTRSGVTYAYADVVESSGYLFNTTTSADRQAYRVPSEITLDISPVGRAGSKVFLDEQGRVTLSQVQRNGTVRRSSTITYKGGESYGPYIYRPNSPDVIEDDRALPSKQYGDLPAQVVQSNGGETRQYWYDALGNPSVEIAPNVLATATTAGVQTTSQQVVIRAFNGFGQQVFNMVYSDQGVGQVSATNYVANGAITDSWEGNVNNVRQYSYDANGRLGNVVRGVGTNGVVGTSHGSMTFAYDPDFGRASTQTIDNVLSKGFSYDTLDRVTRTSHLQSSDAGDNVVHNDTRYDVGGLKNYECQSGGGSNLPNQTRCVISSIDSLGRATSRQDWTAIAGTPYTINFDYDNFDRMIYQRNNGLSNVDSTQNINASGEDNASYYVYDEYGHLLKQLSPVMRSGTITATGVGGNTTITDTRRPFMQYRYTDFGLQYAKAVLTKGSVSLAQLAGYDLITGACVSPTDIFADLNSAITCTNYDQRDRVSSQYDPDGYQTVFTYDALDHVDTQTRVVWKSASAYGRSTTNTDAGFGDTVTTTYAYDAVGRVIWTTDPRGINKGVRYDTLGNPLSEMTETKLRANVQDYVTAKITSKMYQYTSDGLLERVLEPALSDAINVANNWGLTYSGGALPGGYALTKLFDYALPHRSLPSQMCVVYKNAAPVVGGNKCTSYDYDNLGRVKNTTLPKAGLAANPIVKQKYDTRNNVVSMTDADGFVTDYNYDARGNLRQETKLRRTGAGSVTDNAALPGDLVNSYAYDNVNNLVSKTERGLKTEYAYNSMGKVMGEAKPHIPTSSSIDKIYAYRLDGGLVAETVYGTRASVFANPDNFGFATNQVPEYGAIQAYQLSPSGIKIREYLKGTTSTDNLVAYENTYWINGLGKWYLRRFIGTGSIYEQVFEPGKPNLPLGPNYLTYHMNDQNGNLLSSADEYTTSSGTFKQNEFSYQYSPSGKQINEKRRVQVAANKLWNWCGVGSPAAVCPSNNNTAKDTTHNLGSSENAAGLNYSNTWYNERDLLEKASVNDVNSIGTAPVQRDTVYFYNDDGSKAKQQVGGVDALTYDYDTRGRTSLVTDNNGSIGSNNTATTESTSYAATGDVTSTLKNNANVVLYSRLSAPTVGGLEAGAYTTSTKGFASCNLSGVGAECFSNTSRSYDANGFLSLESGTFGGTALASIQETGTPSYDSYGQMYRYVTPKITRNTTFNELGAILNETASETAPGTAASLGTEGDRRPYSGQAISGMPALDGGTLASASNTYTLDPRGFRLRHTGTSGSNLTGSTKRYNAEMQASYFSYETFPTYTNVQTVGGYGSSTIPTYQAKKIYFRYNPAGEQVYAVSALINEHGNVVTPPPTPRVSSPGTAYSYLSTYSTASVDGATQALVYRTGAYGTDVTTNNPSEGQWYYSNLLPISASVQDETFGLADGLANGAASFNLVKPYDITTPTQPGNAPLEAPTAALSTTTRVDPTAIEAPGSTPSTDTPSSNIEAPKVETKVQPASTANTPSFSSGTNLNAASATPSPSTPTFGVTAFTISPNVIPSSSNTSGQPNAEPTPTFSTEFSLETPMSVLPSTISSLSVSSIVSPLEDLSSVPNLGSIGDIAAPGIATPGTVSTPSSGAGGITAPADSSAGVPELPKIESPNGNVSSVIAPIGTKSDGVNTLGYGYNILGDCVKSGTFGDCNPSDELEKKRDAELKRAQKAAGDARDAALASAARLQAQLDLRKQFGNDRVADQQISRMENSNFYDGLEKNPRAKTEFWLGVGQQARSGKLTREKGWELVYVLERSAPVLDKNGRIIGYVEVPKGSKSKGYRQMDGGAFAPIGGAGTLARAFGVGAAVAGAFYFGSMAGIGDDRFHMGMPILDGLLKAGQRLASETKKPGEVEKTFEEMLDDYPPSDPKSNRLPPPEGGFDWEDSLGANVDHITGSGRGISEKEFEDAYSDPNKVSVRADAGNRAYEATTSNGRRITIVVTDGPNGSVRPVTAHKTGK